MKRLIALAAATAALSGCAALTPARLPEGNAFRLWMPDASTVQVIGDMNGWGGLSEAGGRLDPGIGAMTLGEDGFWTLEMPLPRGGCRYVFMVDGYMWVPDRLNPVRAGYLGHEVSVIVTGE